MMVHASSLVGAIACLVASPLSGQAAPAPGTGPAPSPTVMPYVGIHHPTRELFPHPTGAPGVRSGDALLIGGRLEVPLSRRAALQADVSHAKPPLRYREEDDIPEGRANFWAVSGRVAYYLLPATGPVMAAVSGGGGLLHFVPESIYDAGETWPTVVAGVMAGIRATQRWTVVLTGEGQFYRARSGTLRADQADLRASLGLRLPL